MVTVYIPEDFEAEVSVMLALASHPRDVQTTTDYGKLAVVIPENLLYRFHLYQSLSESSPPPVVPKKKGSKTS